MSETDFEAPDAAEPPVPVAALPVTSHASIDAALADFHLTDDVHTHHDEIAAVLEVVQQALNATRQPPLPRP